MIVDKDTPPPLRSAMSAVAWERCGDPFHVDAFKGTGVDLDKAICIGGEISKGVRREGWMALDWCGNPVGWIHDGAEVAGDPQPYEIKQGPFGKEWHPIAGEQP
jgi:hypothetical protein